MPTDCNLSFETLDKIRRAPLHAVLRELGEQAVKFHVHKTDDFKKLIAFILELADGRDRRESWTQRPGNVRPFPRLRLAVEAAFGTYAELQWFNLNRTANNSGLPLTGMFNRMSAVMARIAPEDFGHIVSALISDSPDAALLKVLHESGGKIKGLGLEIFSRLAYAFRRDMFFTLPQPWAEDSGCQKYINGDLRKYCALCRSLRVICDRVRMTASIRGSVFLTAMKQDEVDEQLMNVLNRSLGPALVTYSLLDADDAYVPRTREDDEAGMPMEFAAKSIRARRGEKRLRTLLRQSYGDRCGISGPCPRDLLEVAYIVPFPTGNVHSMANALLLRSDLHTLWDLNLIGIDPDDLKVQVSKKLKGTMYEELNGQSIVAPKDGTVVSSASLRERWKNFKGDQGLLPSEKTIKPAKKTAKADTHRHRREEAFPERATTNGAPGSTASNGSSQNHDSHVGMKM